MTVGNYKANYSLKKVKHPNMNKGEFNGMKIKQFNSYTVHIVVLGNDCVLMGNGRSGCIARIYCVKQFRKQ
jgi:D-arabinose 5-phosphate isomerase GutQ